MNKEVSQLAHFTKTMTDQEILNRAEEIKSKKIKEECEWNNLQCDNIKKTWYNETMSKLKQKLEYISTKTSEEAIKKFEEEKLIEQQKIEKEIQSLGEYKGQCLHLGGTRMSRWITDRYDSHGYQLTLCNMCGKTM